MLFRSVRIVARFYNSSSTTIPRFLYSSLISRRYSSVCLGSPSDSAQENESRSAIDSVVKIFSFYRKPNVVQPWQTTEEEYSGSGFAISGRRILTSAHVADHAYVQVRKHGSPTKHKAKVEAFGYECGDTISVTKGVVSRIESREYAKSSIKLLVIQTDAAINSGDSGGPVVMGKKVVGVLINEVYPLSGAHGILKKEDVILAIDGVSIGNNGTIPFREEEPVDFDYLFPLKKPGESVLLKVLRKGRQHEFSINITLEKLLVPDQYLLSYYILSGFVLVPLSKPFIDESADMCECPTYEKARVSGEQIVIISKVMNVNGVEVLNLRQLSLILEECCAEQLSFDLENGNVIAVNCKSAKEETPLMLEHHGIRSAMSKDLMKKEASELPSSAVA
ncbi:putative Do-like 15 protein [Hirschfeldia incana]|nr:putative Do-like 15 protein [Hirschfeldia incana]